QIKVIGQQGNLVPVSELTEVQEVKSDKSIYHKNLMPVVYVTADVAGVVESPVYAILGLNDKIAELKLPEGYELERYVASQPFLTNKYAMKWDGEWHITYEVFRDMGIAFAAVMVLIYILVVGWFQSFKTPLTIMAAIPFSLVGILPAHALMGAFFTATSMIGFIAGAGIVVRNSIILVDFVELRMQHGMSLVDAVVDAGAVRFRPMLLTAAAVIVGSAVMLADPIFQGLAISLMAGEVASLLLSRMAVPVLFYLSERKKHPETAVKLNEKTVLVPTDFSPQSAIALKFADKIANVFGAKLRVLNAHEPDLPPYFTQSQLEEIAVEEQQIEDENVLQIKGFVKENLDTESNVDPIFVDDSPVSAILEEAEKADTILIALGTHGRKGVEKLKFGSVAETILRESEAPVLTINPNVRLAENVEIKRVICLFDSSEKSENITEYAQRLSKSFNAELSVVEINKKGKSLKKIFSEISVGDLLIVKRNYHLFTEESLGESTAELIRNAPCPVITIPENLLNRH
ncbi:MAG: efflux RND transporter permease subunit, partial [Pyrinomonadaceae bacterium]|nr:efflux RND transporter permease subunit [Pyrinomonadaceae bacterium]